MPDACSGLQVPGVLELELRMVETLHGNIPLEEYLVLLTDEPSSQALDLRICKPNTLVHSADSSFHSGCNSPKWKRLLGFPRLQEGQQGNDSLVGGLEELKAPTSFSLSTVTPREESTETSVWLNRGS